MLMYSITVHKKSLYVAEASLTALVIVPLIVCVRLVCVCLVCVMLTFVCQRACVYIRHTIHVRACMHACAPASMCMH